MNAEAEALPSSPLPFVAIAPCRIVDTRVAVSDGFHQPNFGDDEARTFPLPSSTDCPGLPATAGAWSVNVQFRPMTQLSFLTAYPTGTTMPLVSTLTAGPAAWVQNAAIVPAGTGGAIDLYCQYAGRVVIDINGYYGPQSVVTSLNAKIGDVTLAEGSNVTITPSGSTLTIAASAPIGPSGPTGDTGPAGPTGATGPAGSPGPTGLQGDPGIQGIPGPTGPEGPQGLQGVSGATGPAGPTGATGLQGLVWKGPWSVATTYDLHDAVAFNGSSYVSLQGDNTNQTPGVATAYWDPLAREGAAGPTGATGDAGIAGPTGVTGPQGGIGPTGATGPVGPTGPLVPGAASQTLYHNGADWAASSALANDGTNIWISGVLDLTAATPAARRLSLNGAPFLHEYAGPETDGHNTFVGQGAGNLTMDKETETFEASYNTVLGFYGLSANTTGYDNSVLGASTLQANTTGFRNTASGAAAMYNNTTGHENTAAGSHSLFSNSEGYSNTAVGVWSLSSSTTGSENTAIGAWSLRWTTGANNIAVGYGAGINRTAGDWNIDIGNPGAPDEGNTIRIGDANQSRAFIAGIRGATPGVSDGLPVIIDSNGQLGTSASVGAVTSVFGRTGAVTAGAGDYAASQVGNTPAGGIAANDVQSAINELDAHKAPTVHTHLSAQITGLTPGGITFGDGSGSLVQDASNILWDATNHRLGLGIVSPSQQLELTGMMRMPTTSATAGTPTAGVLYLGTDRFLHNFGPAGAGNTFLGEQAGNFTMGGTGLQGTRNTAVGATSLVANTLGYGNTASGYQSLYVNSMGGYNTASGYQSLYSNTYGSSNTATGALSLFLNTEGLYNTATGERSMFANTAGLYNTAAGYQSLYSNKEGWENTASGNQSLYSNTYGSYNTASGTFSLYHNTTGEGNTAIGYDAGENNYTGSYNTFLGAGSWGFDGLTNATAVGYEAKVDASNKVRIGNSLVTVIEGQVDWSFPSDIRHKKDVRDLPFGLDLILQLRPVEYRLRTGNDRLDMGFIAQEIEAVLGDGYNILGIGEEPERMLSLRRGELIAPLVKAIQEQQAQMEAKDTRIAALESRQAAQQAEIEALKGQLAGLMGLKVAVEELRRQVRMPGE